MKKPISKEINGTTWYARQFSLAGQNEIKQAGFQSLLGDAKMSQADLRELTVNSTNPDDIGAAAQEHLKMPMVSVMMQATVLRSIKLKNSLCTADGVFKFRSVADFENNIDPDIVDDLYALVIEANPAKEITIQLEDAEKN